jgi:hypothetical protein
MLIGVIRWIYNVEEKVVSVLNAASQYSRKAAPPMPEDWG